MEAYKAMMTCIQRLLKDMNSIGDLRAAVEKLRSESTIEHIALNNSALNYVEKLIPLIDSSAINFKHEITEQENQSLPENGFKVGDKVIYGDDEIIGKIEFIHPSEYNFVGYAYIVSDIGKKYIVPTCMIYHAPNVDNQKRKLRPGDRVIYSLDNKVYLGTIIYIRDYNRVSVRFDKYPDLCLMDADVLRLAPSVSDNIPGLRSTELSEGK
jgi:hypothetical protein